MCAGFATRGRRKKEEALPEKISPEKSSTGACPPYDEAKADASPEANLYLCDPTEKDHLSLLRANARARLWRAVGELLAALWGLLCALLAGRMLRRAARKVGRENRGAAVGAEQSVLALEKVLSGFLCRRIAGANNVISLFGARSTPGVGKHLCLKLSQRDYGGPDGGGTSRRVLLGVRVSAYGGAPEWCVRRFHQTEEGLWRESAGCTCYPQASEALLAFFSDSPETAQGEGELAGAA